MPHHPPCRPYAMRPCTIVHASRPARHAQKPSKTATVWLPQMSTVACPSRLSHGLTRFSQWGPGYLGLFAALVAHFWPQSSMGCLVVRLQYELVPPHGHGIHQRLRVSEATEATAINRWSRTARADSANPAAFDLDRLSHVAYGTSSTVYRVQTGPRLGLALPYVITWTGFYRSVALLVPFVLARIHSMFVHSHNVGIQPSRTPPHNRRLGLPTSHPHPKPMCAF
jgi:hypothetical protein